MTANNTNDTSIRQKIAPVFSNPIWLNLAVIIVASLVIVFISYNFFFPAVEQAEESAVRFQDSVAIETQHLVNLFLQFRYEDIVHMGNHILEDNQKNLENTEEISQSAQVYFKGKSGFSEFLLLGSEGEIVSLINRTQEQIASSSASYKDALFFKEPFSTKENYISSVYFSPNGPSVRLSRYIADDNGFEGVISGEIDLSILWDLVKTPFVPQGKVYLVDERGTIIADPELERALSGENMKYREVVNRLIKGEEKISLERYVNEDKLNVLAYGMKMPFTNWGIVVEQDEQFALQQKNRTIALALGFTVISIVLLSILTISSIRLAKALVTAKSEHDIASAERNKLAIILSGITDAVIALDLDRKIVSVNKAAEELFNIPSEQAIGKHIKDLIKVYDNDEEIREEIFSPIKIDGSEGVVFQKQDLKLEISILDLNTVPENINLVHRKQSKFVNLIAGNIREGTSVNLGCILTIHDTTKEKELEEMKLDFVSMAAHELRTPFTTIKSYLSVFATENGLTFSDEQKMFLNRMNIATDQLGSLIENLLSVSKIERNAFTVSLRPLDWVSMAKLTVEQMVNRAKEMNVELKFVQPSEPIPWVSADKLRINEVLANLVSNAISYNRPGGSVEVSIEHKDNEVITHVKDTGQGIPKQALSHLFTKFFRVSGVLEQGSKGTGLGLYISKAIVDLHKGRIWVESEVGKGSTFSFSLPVSYQSSQSLNHPSLTNNEKLALNV